LNKKGVLYIIYFLYFVPTLFDFFLNLNIFCLFCIAFAAVASLEGQFKKKTGVLMTLSEQNLIDCTKNGKFVDYTGTVEPKVSGVVKVFQYGADGCNGGSFDAGFQYSKYNRVTTGSNYPFTGVVS